MAGTNAGDYANTPAANPQSDKQNDEPSAALLSDFYNALNQSRRQFEMRWYLSDNFWENNHFVQSINQMGQLEPIKFPRGVQIRPIPRAKKQIRSGVNILTQNDPKWVIYPENTPTPEGQDPQAAAADKKKHEDDVMRLGHWMDDLWNFLGMKKAVGKLVEHGERYNVGYIEIGGDPEGNIFIDNYEPYDVWHDVSVENLQECDIFIKAVNRTIQYVKDVKGGEYEEIKNPLTGEVTIEKVPGSTNGFLYDPSKTKDLKPEARQALSDWKDIKLREKNRGMNRMIEDPRIAKVFLKEIWMRNKEGTFDLITECQGKKLRFVRTKKTRVPFVAYSPNQGALLNTSNLEDLIPMNKGIDIITAMIEGYSRVVGVGRMLKPKLSKLERIQNENGEIIEYEGQQPPTWLPVPPMANTVFSVIQLYTTFMDEVGASFTAFGKAPKGVKAYKAIEAMKQAEFTNRRSSIDNLKEAISEIAEMIMDLGDEYFMNPVTVKHMTDGKPDYFQIASSESPFVQNPEGHVVPVSAKYMVKVEIENAMSYTEEGKRDTYMQLASEGFLPREEVLKVFKFSNIQDIIEKLNEEIKQKQEMEAQAKGGDKPAGKPPSVSIAFKDMPPEAKLQALKEAGITVDPSQLGIAPQSAPVGPAPAPSPMPAPAGPPAQPPAKG